MAYVTTAQIAAAREMDLLTYLQRYMPEELVKASGNTYSTRSHDSLKISNGKWYWWSQKMGGVSALDYLIKVRGASFPDAVEHLLNCMDAPIFARTCQRSGILCKPSAAAAACPRASPESKKELVLPEAYHNNRRVFTYLSSRGIDGEIINFCIAHRMLYEDAAHHNAVFIGYDGKTPRLVLCAAPCRAQPSCRSLPEVKNASVFRYPRGNRVQIWFVFLRALLTLFLLRPF